MIETNKDILKEIYKEKSKETKKYDDGLLIVIGGSDFYSGPPAFSSLAAYKSGVDMVRVIAPKRAADIIASFSPVIAAYPLGGNWLERNDLSILISMTESAKIACQNKVAAVIGGGAGRSEETQKVIIEYLEQANIPAVIDADAIHALAKNPKVIAGKPFLITPHTYEFFVLTKREVKGLEEKEKIKAVEEEALKLGTTILLKGAADIISNGRETALNRTGTPYMAVGGTGDTLAGIAGALMARGVSAFLAGQAGAYINGLAGELAAKKLGESMTAMDLIEEIPNVLPRF